MAKVRQDAWSHEDDLLLAETVLRHVREGSTQLNAFEEVGDKLNRTSAACGFRWNAEVRKKYIDAMELAKRQRKERKRALVNKARKPSQTSFQAYEYTHLPAQSEFSTLTIDQVINFLKELKNDYLASNQSKLTLDHVQEENKELRMKVQTLEKELNKTEEQFQAVQEDYQTFIEIMDRARKMTVLDDQGSLKAPKFRMDKNGNLEQVAQRYNQM